MFKVLKDWLAQSQNGEGIKTLIDSLAGGLATFIGFKNTSNGLIGIDGIAVSNDPFERLRDGVLGFLAGFLGMLKSLPDLIKQGNNISNTIAVLNGGIGKGQQGFSTAITEAERVLQRVNRSVDIKNILTQLKTITSLNNQSTVNEFAGKVKEYFNGVLGAVAKDKSFSSGAPSQAKNHIGTLKGDLETLVTNVGKQTNTYPINVGDQRLGGQQTGLKSDIDKIYKAGSGTLTQLRNAFPNSRQQPAAYALSAATHTATTGFVTVLQTDYTSYYKGATWPRSSGHEAKCAKIFLPCLPLIFNGLSYFYWKCSDRGGWNAMTLGSPEPKAFIGLTSIGANRVKSGLTGSDVLSKAFQNFKEFKTAANGSTTSYAEFMKTFRGNCLTNWKTSSNGNDNFLSGLYLCSTSYFRHQHQKQAANARPPSSIREMLYWLMGLTATPQFGDLLGHIDKVVGDDFKVAVSGSSNKNERLFADDVAGHLITTCFTATPILLTIQGTGDSGKPWLHELFATAGFTFAYPTSGAALFYALSDYTYALQFQLSFLHKQCEDMYINTCGWQFCNFGKDINQSTASQIVESHICSVGCNKSAGEHNGGNHASGYCNHDQGSPGGKCGRDSNNSPLQAFLTDKL
ncbi:variant erythrocyte surface antigen-1 family protein [Babesia caballi]|uniref:Variant erythrocyte surface antigen-1 family protein n=1 Tax=Babesia caballi TaxID=5871 RepID=A0AAV4LNI5_BABCB|nr:variant erythrocyte surface antigen-1 family protein [Babesia caballi]